MAHTDYFHAFHAFPRGFVFLAFWRFAYDTPSVFWIRCHSRISTKRLAGDSAFTPSLGTACCSRGGTGDNASALSLGNSSRGRCITHVS